MFENGKWQYVLKDAYSAHNADIYKYTFARVQTHTHTPNCNGKKFAGFEDSCPNNECNYAINVVWRASTHVDTYEMAMCLVWLALATHPTKWKTHQTEQGGAQNSGSYTVTNVSFIILEPST